LRPLGRPSWFLVTALLVVTAGLSSGATVLAAAWVRAYADPPLPPILRDLSSGTWDAHSAAFTTRLRARYPVGTSEEVLIWGLARDGFRPAWRDTAEGRYAILEWSAFPCAMRATVIWQVDAERRVTSLSGKYHEAGCL
jgi:hypothetical protein